MVRIESVVRALREERDEGEPEYAEEDPDLREKGREKASGRWGTEATSSASSISSLPKLSLLTRRKMFQ